ncbi:Gfo/Idh/MocA family oxidoreductase [Paenibacillus sp.]|uniref:Gfo/Idh/MocA family protein n=1 Tax=Paenibacillus sp. TaxID=58172 RepID=UPI002D389FFC|nr:Gfo/Idh/MocA family oxidoreductase [Paenibacillus sp.]HZG55643.1 Gfo/Idh/MocA family oxidoreductase [Paenibacillus sp.]
MKEVNIGFIGCGMVSELHYQALKHVAGAKLAAIYDVVPEVREQRSREWGVPAYSDLHELLRADGLDAVFVLSPVIHHYEQAVLALSYGKHVLVEKPVSATVLEAREMERLAALRGLVCMPAHNYIYLPEMARLKRSLEEGKLGVVPVSWFLYHVHHPKHIAAGYPGIVRQIGTHLLYAHRYLFGPPAHLTAAASRFLYPELCRDDQVMLSLTMPDGSLANLFASFAVNDASSNPWSFVVKVLGTEGSAQISWQDIVYERPIGTLGRSFGSYEESYEHEIRHFVDACIRNGAPPLSTMSDAAEVMLLVELAESQFRPAGERGGRQI